MPRWPKKPATAEELEKEFLEGPTPPVEEAEVEEAAPLPPVALSAAQLKEILAAVATTATESGAEGMRRAIKPDNPTHPGISVYSYPEGERVHPKPKLTRETFFCGAPQKEDQLTPAEIDAFNAITGERTARNGRWWARVEQYGNRQRLHVFVPNKSIDDRMDLPNGLILILRELADGPEAVSVTSLAEKVKQLEMQLAASRVGHA